jgi:hypothetical protein
MIVEAIIGGITAITCSSLWLCNAIDKRLHKSMEPKAIPEVEPTIPGVKIYPFQRIVPGCTCSVCGIAYKYEGGSSWGPAIPKACKDPKCPALGYGEHLHVHCDSCLSNYFMRTK